MMNLEIDFRSGIPIYLQIVERIKERIASGYLKPGDQLPTVRALALEMRVNFNTVARAYRILDEAGIISTQQGRGTYILDVPPPEVSEAMRRSTFEALTDRYLADATRLSFSSTEIIALIKQQTDQKNDNSNKE
jgi:GntR family transcriptional regulator